MDELIKRYAEYLKKASALDSDYTYERVLADFAREVIENQKQETK